MKKLVIIILAIVLVVIIAFIVVWNVTHFYSNECVSKGGRIVNMEAPIDKPVTCGENETNIGSLDNMMCDCICCIPK